MSALMTIRNNPSVRIVKGKVRYLSRNPSVELTKPITMAATSAATKPRTSKPFTKWATISSDMALTSQRNMSRTGHLRVDPSHPLQASQLRLYGPLSTISLTPRSPAEPSQPLLHEFLRLCSRPDQDAGFWKSPPLHRTFYPRRYALTSSHKACRKQSGPSAIAGRSHSRP